MRRVTSIITVLVAVALVACALEGTAAASNAPFVGHFSRTDHFGPLVVTDLPCLNGKAFTASGTAVSRGTFVGSPAFFHFTGTEQFSATLVPVDGQGPTYVERAGVEHTNFTARAAPAGADLVNTQVNNDRFLGYVNGKLVSSTTIRIHELTHFVGLDTNGDNIPDDFKVSVTVTDVDCP
jgi:hypothetical protein